MGRNPLLFGGGLRATKILPPQCKVMYAKVVSKPCLSHAPALTDIFQKTEGISRSLGYFDFGQSLDVTLGRNIQCRIETLSLSNYGRGRTKRG